MSKNAIVFRTPFNYDADEVSESSGLLCEDDSRTKQSFKDECDINVIVGRFGIGEPPLVPRKIPLQGDFHDAPSFQEVLNMQLQAAETFGALPAKVRERFGNNPVKFVEFFSDEANFDEALKLQLVNPRLKPVEPSPMLVRVVADESKK